MTARDFSSNCASYFGPWKNQGVRITVEAYLSRRAENYLDALWPLLRDSRNTSFGAPDMKALTDLHVEACDEMDRVTALRALDGVTKQITDGDEMLTREQSKAALEELERRLRAKVVTRG
jgi:hypothetical protein